MTLLLDEKQNNWEFRDGRVLVLSFTWNPERVEYVTDRGEGLGPAWPSAVKGAEDQAEARLRKKARTA